MYTRTVTGNTGIIQKCFKVPYFPNKLMANETCMSHERSYPMVHFESGQVCRVAAEKLLPINGRTITAKEFIEVMGDAQ